MMPTGRRTSLPAAPFAARLLVGLIVLAVLAVALGAWGFARLEPGGSLLDDLYRALQLLALNAAIDADALPWQLEIARFLAPLAGAAAVLQAVLLVVRDAFDGVRARFARDHVIVAGLGSYGTRLVEAFIARGDRVVAIELDPGNAAVATVRDAGASVIHTDARTPAGLRRARADRARHLLVTCGDDATNVAVGFRACGQARRRGALTTLVQLEELRLWPRLKPRAFAIDSPGHRLEFFNPHDTAARILLDRYPPFGRLDERRPKVVLVGANGMADMLLLHAARLWRRWPRRDRRLEVILTAADAAAHVSRLHLAHPELDRLVTLTPSRDPLVPVHEGEALEPPPTAIYVCGDSETDAATSGIALAEALPPGAPPVVVVVRDERAGLMAMLQRGPGAVPGLVTFGVLDNALPPELLLRGTNEILARAKHEQYVEAERARGIEPAENPSLVPWTALPETLKASNRAFAARIGPKLEATGWLLVPDPLIDASAVDVAFSADEVEALARMEHDGWCEALLQDGWRADGPAKDPERKLHPLLVPWAELPERERDKDRESVRAIPRMLAEAGFRLFPATGSRP
jgi:hypothetical protein